MSSPSPAWTSLPPTATASISAGSVVLDDIEAALPAADPLPPRTSTSLDSPKPPSAHPTQPRSSGGRAKNYCFTATDDLIIAREACQRKRAADRQDYRKEPSRPLQEDPGSVRSPGRLAEKDVGSWRVGELEDLLGMMAEARNTIDREEKGELEVKERREARKERVGKELVELSSARRVWMVARRVQWFRQRPTSPASLLIRSAWRLSASAWLSKKEEREADHEARREERESHEQAGAGEVQAHDGDDEQCYAGKAVEPIPRAGRGRGRGAGACCARAASV
eukprot:IDg21818t1